MNHPFFAFKRLSARTAGTILTLIMGILTLCVALDVNPLAKGTFLASPAWALGPDQAAASSPTAHAPVNAPASNDLATSATTARQTDSAEPKAAASAFQPDPLQSLAESLRLKERQLAAREAAVVKKEKYLEALQLEVQQTLAKVEQERGKMEAMSSQADADRQKQVKKWIEIFQKMAPEKVAPVLSGLTLEFQLQLLGQMDSGKAAKILNAFPPDKAAMISGQLNH